MEDIISERGINVHFYPMQSDRWNKLNGKYIRNKNRKPVFIAQENSRWDLNCFKFMDFLSSYVKKEWDIYCFEGYGETVLNVNSELMNIIPLFRNYSKIYEFGKTTKFNALDMYKCEYIIPIKTITSFPSCKKMNINHIRDVLNKISSCKVKSEYAIYSEDSIKQPTWQNLFSNLNDTDSFQSFFDFEIMSSKGKNGKEYNTIIKIKFNSQLGAIFLHNIYSTGYCRITEPFYNLSKNAQILYRKRFLPYTKAAQKVYLNMDPVFHILGLTNTSNKTVALKTFNSIIEELVDFKLIKICEIVNSESIIVSKNINKKKKSEIIDISKYLKYNIK